ncbi:hypothetical protein [Psychromonas sp. Urea-02u-13]|uniref:hypothetical protein n=1 Tax=Psychromonas sp. Urea-02u-13 TaxID=2058326 RepID=UPI000C33CCDC|nr:hypothetical protein [Psychromonas sp. Urea-02u-13]PKG37491.1 hypothetical protein CXF74_18635 [Psychromonas sp. Urea-02u-13]
MTTLTVNCIKSSIAHKVAEALNLPVLAITADMDKDDISELLREQVEAQSVHYEVIYNHEAIEIVYGEIGNTYDAECLDFTGITSSRDAVMIEAQGIVDAVLYEAISETIEEIAERFTEICATANGLGYSGKMSASTGDNYGWNSHAYETEEGTCVHLNLEGENLTAVVGGINSLYLSACFT